MIGAISSICDGLNSFPPPPPPPDKKSVVCEGMITIGAITVVMVTPFSLNSKKL